MTSHFPQSKKEWAAYLLASAISVGLIYIAMYAEEGTLELRILRTSTRILQGTARHVGNLGMKTERLYYDLLNNNRMV